MAVWDDGSGPALYISGQFESAGGVEAHNIARWDGTSWSALEGPAGNGIDWAALALRGFDVFGNRAVVAHISGSRAASTPFAVRGPYQWVRHPLYFFTLVLIWSIPDMTLDRLLFNVLFTGWIVVGTRLEERDLVAEFGEQYRAYQRRVPMLIPYKIHQGRTRLTHRNK